MVDEVARRHPSCIEKRDREVRRAAIDIAEDDGDRTSRAAARNPVDLHPQRILGAVDAVVDLERQVAHVLVGARSAEDERLVPVQGHVGVDPAEIDLVEALLEIGDHVERDRPALRDDGRAVDVGDERVVARASGEEVDPVAAAHHVIAGIADQAVAGAVADDDVVAASADRILDDRSVGNADIVDQQAGIGIGGQIRHPQVVARLRKRGVAGGGAVGVDLRERRRVGHGDPADAAHRSRRQVDDLVGRIARRVERIDSAGVPDRHHRSRRQVEVERIATGGVRGGMEAVGRVAGPGGHVRAVHPLRGVDVMDHGRRAVGDRAHAIVMVLDPDVARVSVGHDRIVADVLRILGAVLVGDREPRPEVIGAGVREAERMPDLVDQGVQSVEALVELEVARLARGDPDVAANLEDLRVDDRIAGDGRGRKAGIGLRPRCAGKVAEIDVAVVRAGFAEAHRDDVVPIADRFARRGLLRGRKRCEVEELRQAEEPAVEGIDVAIVEEVVLAGVEPEIDRGQIAVRARRSIGADGPAGLSAVEVGGNLVGRRDRVVVGGAAGKRIQRRMKRVRAEIELVV